MDFRKKLEEKILAGNFSEAKKDIKSIEFEEVSNCLIKMSFENRNILSYAFVSYLISQNETSKLHILASSILCLGLCSLNGAYQAAFFHARRAIELEPHNIDYKEELLFFYGNSEKLISKKEAIDIAKEVLREKPLSEPAKRIVKDDSN